MLEKILGPFREFGVFGGSVYAVGRALNALSPNLRLFSHYWMVQPIPDKPLLPAKFMANISLRQIEQGDPLLDLMPIPQEILHLRFEQDAICLALIISDRLAGYIWLCFDQYEEDEARCTFVLTPEEQSVFDFNLFIFPDYRGGIAFLALWDACSTFLRQRGIRYTYSRLTAQNVVSANSHNHFGWKRIGTAIVLRMWALEIIFTSRSPYLFASLNDSSRLVVELTPSVLAEGAEVA